MSDYYDRGAILADLKRQCDEQGLREFARNHSINAANLCNMLKGRKPLSAKVIAAAGFEPVPRWRKSQ